jgi:hypothetical protein
MPIIKIDTKKIVDWESFHSSFAQAFGFPDFYGRNMDAWIDCMTYLDDPEAGMSSIHAEPGGVVTIQLEHVYDFSTRLPEIYENLIECAAFVNWRRIETGHQAILALSFHKSPSK